MGNLAELLHNYSTRDPQDGILTKETLYARKINTFSNNNTIHSCNKLHLT